MKTIIKKESEAIEYVKGEPYFCRGEKIAAYPYLNKDLTADILIIGGGIVGAIANYYLSEKYDVALVDKSRFGFGCTSCATVLLEYQLDDFAEELLKYFSEEEIVSVYKMGLQSIEKISNFIQEHGNFCHFSKRPSLLYTNSIFGTAAIEKEYAFRKKHNFNAKLITRENNHFPFDFEAGLYCEDGGAEFNPYLFAKQMIESATNQNKLFEHTEICDITETEDGLIARTNYGQKIHCKKVIFATGYNFELLTSAALCTKSISYTIVTRPIPNLKIPKNALLQDDQEPYHYMRVLPDNRIIFGGEDTSFKHGEIKAKKAEKKYAKLEEELHKMFPNFKNEIEVEFKFCGAFGETKNNLGLIGTTQNPDILLMISCGANGVINAMFGAELIEDILENRANPLEKHFSPLREN